MKVLSALYGDLPDLPVDVEDLKAFIRQYSTHEDDMLTRVLRGAVVEAEQYLQVSLSTQSRIAKISSQPERLIELDMGPVHSITSVKYTDPSTGDLVTIDADFYALEESVLYPVDAQSWPQTKGEVLGGFQVIYVAGVANDAVSPAVPLEANIETGIFLLAQGIIEKRSDCRDAGFQMIDYSRKGQGL